MILGALIGLQNQSDSASSNTATDTTSTTDSTTSSDPVQSLYSAMDTNSDGVVSQSELENYLEQLGGTSDQADSLFASLNQSGSDGITESDLESQAPPPPPSGGGHPPGPPPSGGGTDSSSGIGNDLVKLFDTSNDNSVSKSEFESFITSNGGTTEEASTDFSAIDSSSSGSLSASDFEKALTSLQERMAANPYSSMLTLLDAFAGTGNSVSVTA
jgi:Ca2+-binding EF-hand superfamily protein